MGTSSSKYSSNDYELVIRTSKDLEYILEHNFGSSGRGLHEKLSNVQGVLPQKLVARMRYLATIRNRLIHERGFDEIPNRESFIVQFEECEQELRKLIIERSRARRLEQGGAERCFIM